MAFTTLLFDLDDTLYPSDSGLWDAIRDRINLYMIEKLRIPAEQVPDLRRSYFETHGTTLRGLQIHYNADPDEFLAYVHDLPLGEFIRPDPGLRQLLIFLPQKKWIFTNADDAHARRVLKELELIDCFDGIIDVRAVGFNCKPSGEAYHRALALAGESRPEQCVFFDDSLRNLAPAQKLGFFTVLVGPQAGGSSVCLSIRSLLDLPTALPQLWNGTMDL